MILSVKIKKIVHGNQLHIFLRRILKLRNAAGLIRDDLFKEVADFARIGEVFRLCELSRDNNLPDMLFRILFDLIVLLRTVQVENRLQLVHRVLRELHILIKAGLQPRIAVDELLHRLRVPGDNHDEVVPMIFHSL